MFPSKPIFSLLFFLIFFNLSSSISISDLPFSPSLSHASSFRVPSNQQAVHEVKKAHIRKSKEQPLKEEAPTNPEEAQVSKPDHPKRKESQPEGNKEEPEKNKSSEESQTNQNGKDGKTGDETNPAKATDETATSEQNNEPNSDVPSGVPDQQTPSSNQTESDDAKHQPADESSSTGNAKPENETGLGDNEAKKDTSGTDKSVLSKANVTGGLRSAGIMIVVVVAIAGGYFVGKATGLCGGGAVQRYADIRRGDDAEEADGWNDDWGNDDWDDEDEKP